MPSPSELCLLDVTVRDGSYLINHQFSPQKVAEIAKGLSDAGVTHAEISHGVGIGGKMMGFPALVDDEELLVSAKQAAPNLKLTVFISPSDIVLPIIPGLIEYFEIGRIGVDVNEISLIEKFINKLKKYQKQVSVQLTRCHNRPPEDAALAAKKAESMGADIIYVVDTFGSMLPNDVKNYFAAVRAEIKSAALGFHGHNNLGLAVSNTLTAWKEGATWLDASLLGVGRSAGNARLETIIHHLHHQGLAETIDLQKLCELSERIIPPFFGKIPSTDYIDYLFSQDKLDFSPSSFLELCAHAAGTEVDDFLMQIQNKMGASIAMREEHLQLALKDYGVDLKKMLDLLQQQ